MNLMVSREKRDSAVPQNAWRDEIPPLNAEKQTQPTHIIKRLLIPALWVTVAGVISFLVLRHLVPQARSQGFVLEELKPIMDAAIGCGKILYWLGGRPMFLPTTLILLFAAATFVSSLFSRKSGPPIARNTWTFVLTISFFSMCFIGGTSSFPLYIFGIIMLPTLGWAGQRLSADIQSGIASPGLKEKIAVAAILVLGLLLRLYAVDVFPRLYTVDEQLLAQVALELGEKGRAFFTEPNIMKPHLVRIAAIRLAFSTLGVGLFQERAVSVMEGTLTILLVYLLCRKLWGNGAGVFAALMLAVDPWHIGESRLAVHGIEGPLFLVVLLYLIIRAVEVGGKRNFALLGAVTGATIYLYLSCLAMIPFSWAAVAMGRYHWKRVNKSALTGEMLAMAVAFVVVVLPYFTLGRANIRELDNFYSTSAHFLAAARDRHWNPAFVLFVNFWRGVEYMIDWTSRAVHPSKTFYPNPIMVGFSLLGLGIAMRLRKNFQNLLVLAWILAAFIPMTLSYGFAERRLFATLVPIPTMLAGLLLARLWGDSRTDGIQLAEKLRRTLVLSLLAVVTLTSTYIVYADADPLSGGSPHPRKVAEFIGSIPPDYHVLISNRVKQIPFLVYLQSYDRIRKAGTEKTFSFIDFEVLRAMTEKIAATPRTAVVTDPGPEEEAFLERIKALNPRADIIKSSDYWACVLPAD